MIFAERAWERMSVVEDVRKVVQDFLAPELRELKVRLDGAEKRADERHADLIKRADERQADTLRRFEEVAGRIGELTKQAAERHAEVMDALRASDARMDRRVDSILNFTELREKVSVLEAERQARQKVAS